MTRMRFTWRSCAVLSALALILGLLVMPGSGQAQELRLTLPEARSVAAQLLRNGQPAQALILAEGVLLGAPGDVPGLILKSRALRDLGRNDEAEQAASQAWKAAATDKDRFFAALVVAQAKASDGKRGIAQYWLRRAAQIAPDDGLRAVAVRDYRHVRRTTPWRLSFAATLAPSDNLNGAPKTNAFTLGTLRFVNPGAVPLSGFRYGASGTLRYTLPVGQRSRVNLEIGGSFERVELSRDARNKVPAARNADYSRDTVETRLEWEKIGQEGQYLTSAALVLGREWQGGGLLSDVARVELSYARRVGEGLEVGLKAAAETEKRHDLRLRDAQSLMLNAHVQKRFASGAQVQLDLRGTDTRSESAAIANVARRAVLSFALGKPVAGVLPQIAFSYEAMDFDRPLYGTSERRDETRGLSLNLLMPKLNYYGFAPEIGVSFTDRRSNYSLFESESTDLRLGIRSVF